MKEMQQFQKHPVRGRHYRRRRRDFIDALKDRPSHPDIPVLNVGQRLREFRTDRNLSIRELSRESGLNVNTLSMIENGKASPSLETLQQLSLALDTPIAAFFEDRRPRDQIMYYRSGKRPTVAFSHGILEELGSSSSCHGVVTALVTINPLSNSGDHYIVHTGHETVYCLEGCLTYTIDGQDYQLEPGDSLFFEAHIPHRWQNFGRNPVRSMLVLIPSDEQDRPTERHFNPEESDVLVPLENAIDQDKERR
jgi:transcriptional regulator with XRE-family HTH domain